MKDKVIDNEIKTTIDKINTLSHEDMARLWRFAPVGHIYFNCQLPFWAVFEKRWLEFGGWNSELSKRIGLGE